METLIRETAKDYILEALKGGKGSGFFSKAGHVGIIGHQGGSAHEGSGISSTIIAKEPVIGALFGRYRNLTFENILDMEDSNNRGYQGYWINNDNKLVTDSDMGLHTQIAAREILSNTFPDATDLEKQEADQVIRTGDMEFVRTEFVAIRNGWIKVRDSYDDNDNPFVTIATEKITAPFIKKIRRFYDQGRMLPLELNQKITIIEPDANGNVAGEVSTTFGEFMMAHGLTRDYNTITLKGGPTSGNHGHAGIPGHLGGSAPKGSGISNLQQDKPGFSHEGELGWRPKYTGDETISRGLSSRLRFVGNVNDEYRNDVSTRYQSWINATESSLPEGIGLFDHSKISSIVCHLTNDSFQKSYAETLIRETINSQGAWGAGGPYPLTYADEGSVEWDTVVSDVAKTANGVLGFYDKNDRLVMRPINQSGDVSATKNGNGEDYNGFMVFAHEIGHAVQNSFTVDNWSIRWETDQSFDRNTTYAESSSEEGFAETFAVYAHTRKKTMSNIPKEFIAIDSLLETGWAMTPQTKGGKGSGFFSKAGHVGIIGHQGGSAHEGSGISSTIIAKEPVIGALFGRYRNLTFENILDMEDFNHRGYQGYWINNDNKLVTDSNMGIHTQIAAREILSNTFPDATDLEKQEADQIIRTGYLEFVRTEFVAIRNGWIKVRDSYDDDDKPFVTIATEKITAPFIKKIQRFYDQGRMLPLEPNQKITIIEPDANGNVAGEVSTTFGEFMMAHGLTRDYNTITLKGGPTSGNHGHAGIPGHLGGSAPKGSGISSMVHDVRQSGKRDDNFDLELYDFQNTKIENHAKRISNRTVGIRLENAGDILRELLVKQEPAESYISEKLTRIKSEFSNPAELLETLKSSDQNLIDDAKRLYLSMPLKAKLSKIANKIIVGICEQDIDFIKTSVKEFEDNYFEKTDKGGKGSGFFARDGHVGIIGHQGGSAREGSGISSMIHDVLPSGERDDLFNENVANEIDVAFDNIGFDYCPKNVGQIGFVAQKTKLGDYLISRSGVMLDVSRSGHDAAARHFLGKTNLKLSVWRKNPLLSMSDVLIEVAGAVRVSGNAKELAIQMSKTHCTRKQKNILLDMIFANPKTNVVLQFAEGNTYGSWFNDKPVPEKSPDIIFSGFDEVTKALKESDGVEISQWSQKGGAGSGFFARDGHVGILGHQGGSAREGFGISNTVERSSGYTEFERQYREGNIVNSVSNLRAEIKLAESEKRDARYYIEDGSFEYKYVPIAEAKALLSEMEKDRTVEVNRVRESLGLPADLKVLIGDKVFTDINSKLSANEKYMLGDLETDIRNRVTEAVNESGIDNFNFQTVSEIMNGYINQVKFLNISEDGKTELKQQLDWVQRGITDGYALNVLRRVSSGEITPSDGYNKYGVYNAKHPEWGDWAPLPQEVYHATTNSKAIIENGLKSRAEIGLGLGLGGGPNNTISFTSDENLAKNVERALHEGHLVASGQIPISRLIDVARSGGGGVGKPWFDTLMMHGLIGDYYKNDGKMPSKLQELIKTESNPPAKDSSEYNSYMNDVWSFYQKYASVREFAGGFSDPVFFATNYRGLAKANPDDFAVHKYKPTTERVLGVKLSSMSEWRIHGGENVTLDKVINYYRTDDIGGIIGE